MRVLVVDEDELAEAVAEGLRQEALAVDVAGAGAEVLDTLTGGAYTVLVLGLRRGPGEDVCRRVAAAGTGVRVLLLTVLVSAADRDAALRTGADDCLAKPFGFAELVARVRALGPGPRAHDRGAVTAAGHRTRCPYEEHGGEPWLCFSLDVY